MFAQSLCHQQIFMDISSLDRLLEPCDNGTLRLPELESISFFASSQSNIGKSTFVTQRLLEIVRGRRATLDVRPIKQLKVTKQIVKPFIQYELERLVPSIVLVYRCRILAWLFGVMMS